MPRQRVGGRGREQRGSERLFLEPSHFRRPRAAPLVLVQGEQQSACNLPEPERGADGWLPGLSSFSQREGEAARAPAGSSASRDGCSWGFSV